MIDVVDYVETFDSKDLKKQIDEKLFKAIQSGFSYYTVTVVGPVFDETSGSYKGSVQCKATNEPGQAQQIYNLNEIRKRLSNSNIDYMKLKQQEVFDKMKEKGLI